MLLMRVLAIGAAPSGRRLDVFANPKILPQDVTLLLPLLLLLLPEVSRMALLVKRRTFVHDVPKIRP